MAKTERRLYCVHEHKYCDTVKDCNYRMDGGDCMLRANVVRQLGTLKRIQLMFLDIGKVISGIWRDPHGKNSSDR